MVITDELRAAGFDEAADLIEQTYGCLWRSLSPKPQVHHARKMLLEAIDREGQLRGIAYATKKFPPVSDSEALANFP